MNVFFTADPHFFHSNIIKYCNRPFKTVEEMNEKIISNYNNIVKDSDTVYFLGDIIFLKNINQIQIFLKRLKGKKILIYGSHDKILREYHNHIAHIFDQQHELLDTIINGQKITMCHYPMTSWHCSHYGSWQLFGHHHNRLPEDPNKLQCDVGVDAWNFTPVSFDQIKAKMATKTFVPLKRREK